MKNSRNRPLFGGFFLIFSSLQAHLVLVRIVMNVESRTHTHTKWPHCSWLRQQLEYTTAIDLDTPQLVFFTPEIPLQNMDTVNDGAIIQFC